MVEHHTAARKAAYIRIMKKRTFESLTPTIVTELKGVFTMMNKKFKTFVGILLCAVMLTTSVTAAFAAKPASTNDATLVDWSTFPVQSTTSYSASYTRAIQTILYYIESGTYAGLIGTNYDGTFNTDTKAAVEKFQKLHNLSVDGKVGPKTWAELQRMISPENFVPTSNDSTLSTSGYVYYYIYTKFYSNTLHSSYAQVYTFRWSTSTGAWQVAKIPGINSTFLASSWTTFYSGN